MRIEVIVSGWEQECCGTPFAVGGEATWQLLAEVPSMAVHPELPLFRDEHHGQTEPEIPHWGVSGTVRAITGVTFPDIEMPGHARTFTSDRSHPMSQPLESVGQSVDDEVSEYHVVLDVPEGTALPAHAASAEETERNSYEARQAEVQRVWLADEVGQILEAHADYAEVHFATTARMLRATNESAMTLEPHADGAAAVRWARSDSPDRDGIHVQIGEGHRSYAANSETFLVVGPLWDRLQRGDHGYAAWDRSSSELAS
jgi:hypothetical protein